ncbi:MAG: ATP synthase F1 subunit epsilon [Patescibacteria group bacterium]|nr:ATP synthase F1 subunit epsilon [Patescibacteria group bacterium]
MSNVKFIMLVNILSLEKVVYQGEVDSLTVPGIMGRLTILAHHTPLITFLKKGNLILRKEGEEKIFEIKKGVLEINPKEVNLLVSLTSF